MQHGTTTVDNDAAEKSEESITKTIQVMHAQFISTLQVPTISMSDVDMMERNPISTAENVYTSENMTIIDTDHVVSC